MKRFIVPSLAEPVGMMWKELQNTYTQSGVFRIASPLSSTPLPIYQWVVKNAKSFSHWDKVRFVLMDEMVEGKSPDFSYVPLNDAASYEGFARKHFLNPLVDKIKNNIEVIKPELSKISTFEIPLDLLILALGVNGNYANVMPDTPFERSWHIAHLTPEFQKTHTQMGSKSYPGAHFQEFGMFLGPQQVLKAKNVVVIISGEKKRELTKQFLSYNSFHPEFPLSIVYHPDITDRVKIILTKDVSK